MERTLMRKKHRQEWMRNRDRELLTQTQETEREVTKRRVGTTDLETQRCRNRGSQNRSPLPFPGAQSVLAEEWGVCVYGLSP